MLTNTFWNNFRIYTRDTVQRYLLRLSSGLRHVPTHDNNAISRGFQLKLDRRDKKSPGQTRHSNIVIVVPINKCDWQTHVIFSISIRQRFCVLIYRHGKNSPPKSDWTTRNRSNVKKKTKNKTRNIDWNNYNLTFIFEFCDVTSSFKYENLLFAVYIYIYILCTFCFFLRFWRCSIATVIIVPYVHRDNI